MNFGRIDSVLLLGGSPLIAEAAKELSAKGWKVTVFSCKRQLEEPMGGGMTLEGLLKKNGTKFFSAEDINTDERFRKAVTPSALAIGIGEAWTFTRETLSRFNGRLVDMMGIPLPRFRGGAHYTWHILQNNRQWGCRIQEVNERMVPGAFDSGGMLKSKDYSFSPSARIPQDLFREAVAHEKAFILEFLEEVKKGKDFQPAKPDESESLFMPRLNTKMQGFIDWSWNADEVERFVCAFDDPYAGASTFLEGRRVFLKKCSLLREEIYFHPFQAGLVYRVSEGGIFVAAKGGALEILEVLDESGKSVLPIVKAGQRFFTPAKNLEEAITYQAAYSAYGAKGGK